MRRRTLEFALFLSFATFLIIFSGCSGLKPFYAAGGSGDFVSRYSELVRGKKVNSTTLYSYVPTSRGYNGKESGQIYSKNGEWRFSISYPASIKLEY